MESIVTERFIKEVFFLGIHKIDDYYAIYAAIMPYFNEIVNLLTISILKPRFGISLFYHFTTNFHQIIVNSIVTLFSISGILANSVRVANRYTSDKGLLIGMMFTIFSFLIPNIFMYDFLKLFKNNFVKLIVGLIVIYILDVIIHLIVYLYRINVLEREGEKISRG